MPYLPIVRDTGEVVGIQPVPEFQAIERFFATEHLRADRYRRALAEVERGPEGWMVVAGWLGIDVGKLVAEDGKVIDLAALLDGLTEAGREAAALNVGMRIEPYPITADALSTTLIGWRFQIAYAGFDDAVVVQVGVVPTLAEMPSA